MGDDDNSSNSQKDDILNKLFFNKYQCIKKLGEGSFGRIYEAIYNNEHFALKFEDREKNVDLLETEASIMNYLKGPNIPFIKSYGSAGNYNILIMQLMGKSLEELINKKKTFSVKTVCLLGFQMVTILEYIHNKHIVHRDIKPDNFVMGLDSLSKRLYILDFGLAKKYRSSRTLQHNPLINKKKLTGTARYASIHALEGYEHSRRDDLEAVGYVLMYFLRGNLPWQGLQGKNKEERYKKILYKKMNTSPSDLCLGFPKEFENYITETRKMQYEEDPNYDNLKKKFLKIIEEDNQDFDYIYDWSTEEEKILRRKEFLDTKNQINEEKKENNNKNKKYLDEQIIYRNRSKDIQINTKFPTKESSIEGNNNYQHFNSNNNINNERKNSQINNKITSKNNNNNSNKEEVCCSEACNII